MEKRIELESRGKNASEVKDLNLDNCRSTSVVGLDDYVNLESLSLINVGLTSLKSFPKLPNLKRLELSDNRISNGLNFLSGSPKLTYLNLSGNKIVNLETLEPLKGFTKLKNLDLFNNEVTSMDAYRTEVFNLIPTLKYLDGYDQEDHEAEDSDGEEEDINGNDDSSDDEAGLDIDLSQLSLGDTGGTDDANTTNQRPLPILLYTLYGFLFHIGTLVKGRSDFMEEEDDDDEEEDISLSAVYNDNLEEESSDDQYEANYDVDEEDEDLDETEDGENNDENQVDPEESTRGKKRKHDDESESNN